MAHKTNYNPSSPSGGWLAFFIGLILLCGGLAYAGYENQGVLKPTGLETIGR